MAQPTIYLASPYGFSAQWRRLLLPEFIAALEGLGLEVWEPFARNGQVDVAQPGWAHQVAQRDLQDVRDADGLFAIVNGTPPDEGVIHLAFRQLYVYVGRAAALSDPEVALPVGIHATRDVHFSLGRHESAADGFQHLHIFGRAVVAKR